MSKPSHHKTKADTFVEVEYQIRRGPQKPDFLGTLEVKSSTQVKVIKKLIQDQLGIEGKPVIKVY